MTDRERQFARVGLHYSEGIERSNIVNLPNGREVRRVKGKWEVQPHNDNYWKQFDDLLNAVKFGLGK